MRQVKDQLVRPRAISRLVRPGAEDRHDREGEDQRGDGEHQIGQAADEVVPPAAPIAGGEAEGGADDAVDDLGNEADGDGDAGAVQHAGVDVAALLVGAEPEFRVGRHFGVHQIGVHHRVGVGEDGGQYREDDRDDAEEAADQQVGAKFHVTGFIRRTGSWGRSTGRRCRAGTRCPPAASRCRARRKASRPRWLARSARRIAGRWWSARARGHCAARAR